MKGWESEEAPLQSQLGVQVPASNNNNNASWKPSQPKKLSSSNAVLGKPLTATKVRRGVPALVRRLREEKVARLAQLAESSWAARSTLEHDSVPAPPSAMVESPRPTGERPTPSKAGTPRWGPGDENAPENNNLLRTGASDAGPRTATALRSAAATWSGRLNSSATANTASPLQSNAKRLAAAVGAPLSHRVASPLPSAVADARAGALRTTTPVSGALPAFPLSSSVVLDDVHAPPVLSRRLAFRVEDTSYNQPD